MKTDEQTRANYIKRLWNANTADEISAILDEYDAEYLPQKPQPNWESAPNWAQWWAVNSDGYSYWFENHPCIIYDYWTTDISSRNTIDSYLDLQGFDWRKTLTQRP